LAIFYSREQLRISPSIVGKRRRFVDTDALRFFGPSQGRGRMKFFG